MNANVLDQVAAAIGQEAVLRADEIPPRHFKDWSGVCERRPLAVARPKHTEDVSAILRICNAAKQPVVVQGGMTGISGGSAPNENELALSMERLNKLEDIDKAALTMSVGAGVVLETVQEAAQEAGMLFPLDLGARGSCQIGGNIATNAGGTQVIRYGMMRELVLGLEAVLADGTVLASMNKMLKNNTGYDLKHLFIGSEGTLGVVTRAVLRLFPATRNSSVALCGLDSFDQAVALMGHCNAQLVGALSSYELMWASYFDTVVENVDGITSPFDRPYPVYALIEANGADSENDSERFLEILGDAQEGGYLENAVIAQSKKEQDDFWRIRDGIGELIPILPNLANIDVSIPIGNMPRFLSDCEREIGESLPESSCLVFGHIGDSNLHMAVSSLTLEDKKKAYSIVYRLTGDNRGAVTAEHGVGVAKRDYVHFSRTPEEIQTMRQLKACLDPNGILNPGRVLTAD